MTYFYETLNDISFQKLVQSLIVSVHPETICLPVRQPDGGRDAFFYNAILERKNFVVFQVKFSENPKESTERDAIEGLIKSEEKKVATLIQKGATHYYFVTNVQGTGHPEVGSIDRVNKALSERFEIPCFVWWRDDLDARLNNASDVKWSFPEICRATDVLQFLIKRQDHKSDPEATRAIIAYMSKQHGEDRDVKFKQVELKRRLTDLFVDIPIGQKGSRPDGTQVQRTHTTEGGIAQYLQQLDEEFEFEAEEDHPFDHGGLAAGFLLHMPFVNGVTRLVLEGAPGQGKSTVTQFLCQVNRLNLLPQRRTELDSVGLVHSGAPTRAPFRIDMRDFAAWMSGRHPYAKAGEVAPPEEGQRSLESFLTMQIGWHSGNLPLSQNQLLDFFVGAHSVVVLDGFDEVADVETRNRVIEEICAASDRLDAHVQSLQIIVTSRPAVFANSPGFPEEDWVHLELKDMKTRDIHAYKEKWSDAQDLTDDEKEALTATLEEKLQQPHLRELSRNPMQLAILLQLMHVQGTALPDKRTALYEEYMKIFLNREVEKKQIAGDHRELILSIHGVLAWVLQVQAETGQGSGSITMEELKTEVTNYLEKEEHDLTLANSLLTGTVERVGALVSRVQGTFEFEVQPLREYFAARHLHKTAPNSPPGAEKQGTRPDRFAALASSSYWTNVTRFYCGFYDVGELPSLVDGLMAVSERTGYNLITQPRRLTLMLLSDYVFTQSPRSMKRLINFVALKPDFERLFATDFGQGLESMVLPETAGGKVLFDVCSVRLQEEGNSDIRKALRQTMARNDDLTRLKGYWLSQAHQRRGENSLLSEARDFGIVDELTPDEVAVLADGNVSLQVRWLVEASLPDEIVADPVLYERAKEDFFNCQVVFPFHRFVRDTASNPLIVLSGLLHPHGFTEYFRMSPEHIVRSGRREFFRQRFLDADGNIANKVQPGTFNEFLQFVVKLMELPPETWRSEPTPWEQLVNRGFEEVPEGRLFTLISLISTAVSSAWNRSEEREGENGVDFQEQFEQDTSQGRWDFRAFSPTPGLVRRLLYAKGKRDDLEWWRGMVSSSEEEAETICLALLLSWGQESVIKRLLSEIGEALEKWDSDRWSWFWDLVNLTMSVSGPQVEKFGHSWFMDNGLFKERVAVVLTRRLAEEANRRAVARKCFLEYQGGDPRILQTAAEWELLTEPFCDIDWDFAKRLSVQARKNEVEYLFSPRRARHRVEVPLKVAEEVLDECSKHNWQFVSLCERSVASSVFKKAKRVSTISEEENWFHDFV